VFTAPWGEGNHIIISKLHLPPRTVSSVTKKNFHQIHRKSAVSVESRWIGLRLPTLTASVVYWSQFLATDPEIPVSIPAAIIFSEQ
jgi:hypothetical protein